MKNKLKLFGIIAVIFMSLIIFSKGNVYAAITQGDQLSSTNLIRLPWHPGTPNLYWHFYFRDTNQTVFCIEPHVTFNSGHTYGYVGKYTGDVGKQMSYVYDSNPPVGSLNETLQVKQTVIWALNGDFNIYGLDRSNTYVNIAIQLYEEARANFNGADISNQMSNHNLTFHLEGNNWVSNWVYIKSGASVWNNIGGLQREGDNWRLVVDNNSLTGPVDAQIYSSMTTRRYNEADIYAGPNNFGANGQDVIITGGSYEDSASETASGHIVPVGNLKILKKDSYGKNLSNATFNVTGNGLNYNVTTGSDGTYTLSNLPIGTYTVTETNAPDKTINDENGRTVQVTVNAASTVTYTRVNSYPRGSVRLTKFDADHRGATLGDATLEGAIYNLCAAEDIYEGDQLIYSNNQVVKTVVTNVNGETEAVTNLPVGKYYYLEIEPSEGFNINPDRINTSVDYEGQFTPVIGEEYNEAPEHPIYSNLHIVKRLGETDYDAEINLAGAQFKATLISNPSQVYYSNVSGEDGVCDINDIPYGKYRIEECKTPDEAYTIEPFEVSFTENGKTYEYTKVDNSKEMQIEVTKEMLLNEGEATDAKVSGAYFTVYTDAEAKNKYVDKNGDVVVIGPTDESGYAISKKMRTGTYYLKETTFPEGVNPDTIIPGEEVSYKDKVYEVSYDNKEQGNDVVVVPITIQNEPERNSIEINKWIGETTSSEKSPLEGAEFTATLISSKGTDHEFSRKCSAPTDENGYCIIEDLPYGEYIIEETKVPDTTLKCSDFKLFVEKSEEHLGRKYQMTDVEFVNPKNTLDDVVKEWLDSKGQLVDEPKVMQIKIRKVDANREDTDAPDMTQGDAVLKGAIYEVYKYNEEKDDYSIHLYDITVDHKDEEGYWVAETGDLLVGKYMVKEKIRCSETAETGKTYDYSYAEGYLVDPNEYYFEQIPSEQTVKRTYHMDVSKEEVIRGRVRVMKYDNNPDSTEESPAAGAILRLTLDSDSNTYYDATVNKYGYAEFIAEEYKEYEPYTIPYGEYTITEIKESDSGKDAFFYIQDENIVVKMQDDDEKRIESDEPVPAWLRIVKKDEETGQNILLEGAKFKIWDVKNSKWVRLMETPSGDYIDEFETSAEGYFYTPQQLQPGEYVVYETQAPDGYYLDDDLRVPEDEKDLGNAEVSGHKVVVNKIATGLEGDAEFPTGGVATGSLVIEVPIYDPVLKVNLHLNKKGEKLVEATSETISYEVNDNGEEATEEKYTPVYKEVGLEGVGYKIYAAEDIYTPDGILRVKKDKEVADIETNSEGEAVAKELYPGEYRIVEYKTPEGYLVDKDIPNVVLENKDQYVQNATAKKELSDVRQKLGLTFEKVFRDIKYSNSEEFEQRAMFGIYTNESVKNYSGKEVIPANKLVDLVWVDENGDVTSNIDLPEGNYYVKELYASYPYDISTIKTNFTLEYNNNPEQEFVIVEGTEFENDYHKATLNLIKMSTSTLGDVTLKGNVITTENLQSEIEELENTFKTMTKEEVENYIYEHNLLALEGAEYTIYTDEACTKPLYIKNEETGKFEEAVMVSGEYGIFTLEDLPINVYWVKETKAPIGHTISNDVVEISLAYNITDVDLYRILVDDGVNGEITKTDIFTGEVVPNCVFEIRDEDDNLLVKSTTDENGIAGFPLDIFENGKTYTYTEIEAPEIYNLNTEPHEFVASYDEETYEWTGEKLEVDNTRKTREVIVRKLDAETGEPLKGCVFTIAMIDPETGEQKVNAKTGEPIYLVENVETDENGEYIIPEAPMGTYKFLEIKAPEGYELDEDLTGYTFTIDNNSPETIIFEVTNTGDIAVIAIASVAVICALGIVFVIRKNKKQA